MGLSSKQRVTIESSHTPLYVLHNICARFPTQLDQDDARKGALYFSIFGDLFKTRAALGRAPAAGPMRGRPKSSNHQQQHQLHRGVGDRPARTPDLRRTPDATHRPPQRPSSARPTVTEWMGLDETQLQRLMSEAHWVGHGTMG